MKSRHPEKENKPVNPIKKKPDWIRSKLTNSKEFFLTKTIVNNNNLVTVCQEANCPNITECWSKRHATFMIMGDTCTRACAFCDVKTGKPKALDIFEPLKIAKELEEAGIKVIGTSTEAIDLAEDRDRFSEILMKLKIAQPKNAFANTVAQTLEKAEEIGYPVLVRPSVANISNIYVTFSVEEPELNLSQVNRFLISAESMGVAVSLVLTKCDLISYKRRSFLIDKFEKWGYKAITLNLGKSDDFNNLLVELKQKECSIFMGPSGVGKTTLLNMIIPGLQNSTAPVSNKIKRGKNTTRNVELFPISNQSYIVDTPGFNMQPLEVDIKLLPNFYSEIYKQVVEKGIKCKFRNCLHLNDEGCNLNKSFERYSFYREMIYV